MDTKPEVALRSYLHKRGLRFRKDYPIRVAKGRIVHPDIVFTNKRVAVFVDGCFWHCCPQHGTIPKSNRGYWAPKLQQNIKRDRANDSALKLTGWKVFRVWEHVDMDEAAAIVVGGLEPT